MTKLPLALVGWLVASVLAVSQEPPPPVPAPIPVQPRAQFFAGSVVELDSTHIKVSRTLVGHPTESRSFNLTPTTKMNKGAIQLHVRVTVRYKHLPEGGDVALEIQLHPVIARTPKV